MNEPGQQTRWGVAAAILAATVAAIAIGVWLVLNQAATGSHPELEIPRNALASSPAAQERPTVEYPIAEYGTLIVKQSTLPVGGLLSLSLAIPDEARGDAPRPVRIAASDGHQIETTARSLPGSGSGIRVDIDVSWLSPGSYLIEVKTAERSHLPLRRFILEVQ